MKLRRNKLVPGEKNSFAITDGELKSSEGIRSSFRALDNRHGGRQRTKLRNLLAGRFGGNQRE